MPKKKPEKTDHRKELNTALTKVERLERENAALKERILELEKKSS